MRMNIARYTVNCFTNNEVSKFIKDYPVMFNSKECMFAGH